MHDVGNSLSVARANVEAMIDGVMDVTPERLRNVADALKKAGEGLEQLGEAIESSGESAR